MADRLGKEEVRRALDEDEARHDITTALLGDSADAPALGRFIAEQACVVAGGPVAHEVFAQLDPAAGFVQYIAEGDRVEAGGVVAAVEAPARIILAGERVALNFLQRLSAIATQTRLAVEAVRGMGTEITDTRKTTPGLRALEKYAVRTGGGLNHRLSLSDAILFKDNHWTLLRRGRGSLGEAIAGAPPDVSVTVEIETEQELALALAAGVTRLLVDNQPPERVAEWVQRCGPDVAIEASGGIVPETAAPYARAGARYISIGALTHSISAIDIRLDLAFA